MKDVRALPKKMFSARQKFGTLHKKSIKSSEEDVNCHPKNRNMPLWTLVSIF